ncbi:MAG: hypothetical protein AB7G08_31470 [Hyphomicrobiaceae bacterium]
MSIDAFQQDFRPNEVKVLKGFFTQASYLRMQDSRELEQRLGYGRDRLSMGWWLLFMLDRPGPADFEFRGYSQMSGGVAQGHLPAPPDRRNAEQRLLDSGVDVGRLKDRIIAEKFTVTGSSRLAKVFPRASGTDYPPGSGIPQWTLVKPCRFRIVEFIAPGKRYEGMYT